jgi:hypothetical protein
VPDAAGPSDGAGAAPGRVQPARRIAVDAAVRATATARWSRGFGRGMRETLPTPPGRIFE